MYKVINGKFVFVVNNKIIGHAGFDVKLIQKATISYEWIYDTKIWMISFKVNDSELAPINCGTAYPADLVMELNDEGVNVILPKTEVEDFERKASEKTIEKIGNKIDDLIYLGFEAERDLSDYQYTRGQCAGRGLYIEYQCPPSAIKFNKSKQSIDKLIEKLGNSKMELLVIKRYNRLIKKYKLMEYT